MNVSKQLSINRIPLCDDVLHIIKSYCFYDIQTAKIREIKKIIVYRFRTAKSTRFTPNGLYPELDEYGNEGDSDTCEHWFTSLSLVSNDNNMYKTIIHEKIFQAVNCSICGGYQMSISPILPQKILCNGHAADW